jgi:hypothetical protein
MRIRILMQMRMLRRGEERRGEAWAWNDQRMSHDVSTSDALLHDVQQTVSAL